jgi:hypothetical protein
MFHVIGWQAASGAFNIRTARCMSIGGRSIMPFKDIIKSLVFAPPEILGAAQVERGQRLAMADASVVLNFAAPEVLSLNR